MTKAILAVLSFVFIQTAFAQQKTYLAAEATVTNDIYEIVDKGGALKRVPLISGLWGFSLRQDLGKNLFIETGLLRKYYDEGIGFKIASDYSETNAINAWLIPLRLGSKLNLYKEKIHLVSLLGFTYSINSDYGYGNGGGSGFEKNALIEVFAAPACLTSIYEPCNGISKCSFCIKLLADNMHCF